MSNYRSADRHSLEALTGILWVEAHLPQEEEDGYPKVGKVTEAASIGFDPLYLPIAFTLTLAVLGSTRTGRPMYGCLGGLLSLGSYPFIVYLHRRQSLNVVKSLAQTNNLGAIGPLTRALEFGGKRARDVAEPGLIALIPHLKAEYAWSLSPEERARLNRALGGDNRELTPAILKAWEQVGDAAAMPRVEGLTRSKDVEIREAAENCLPFLRERAAQRQNEQTLLRPSTDGQASETLLRPAVATETDPRQLLRASNAEK